MSGSAQERDDLADLQALWQTQPTAVAVDVQQLQRSLERRQRFTRIMMWCDWGGTLAMFAVVAWVLMTAPDVDLRTWAWVAFLGSVGMVAVIASMRVRRPVWSVADELEGDAQSLIDASIRQSQASLGIIRIVYWVVGASFVFMIGWIASEFWGAEPLAPDELRRRLLAYGFAFVYGSAFVVGGAIMARRKRAEISRWRELGAALRSDD